MIYVKLYIYTRLREALSTAAGAMPAQAHKYQIVTSLAARTPALYDKRLPDNHDQRFPRYSNSKRLAPQLAGVRRRSCGAGLNISYKCN